MPRLSTALPRYRKHRASGQAIVTLSGQDFYLGPHGTRASRLEYDRLIAEWLVRGRCPLAAEPESTDSVTVVELLAAYKRHAEVYYRKNGLVTNEVNAVLSAARFVQRLYGREPASKFGPLKLKAVREAMIQADWSRKHINKQVARIVRMFSWGAEHEMVSAELVNKLREVKGLHKGRSEARESSPVLPVDDAVVNATLEHLPSIVADMIRFQRFTGCRPMEVCTIRPCDVETSAPVWAYRPDSHKTEHQERERIIFIGPQAQDVLRPYLLREKTAFCFSPHERVRMQRTEKHSARQTPLSCGNRPGTNRKASPQRVAGGRYTTESYRRAIHRACELAFGMPESLRKRPRNETPDQRERRLTKAREWRQEYTWHPNQLRHSAATRIRKKFGLEAAQVTLGHAAADVTQLYAERDMEKAADVMRKIG